MDLVQLFRALGRRWYAVLACLIVIAAGAFFTFRLVPVTYDAKASLLLIPPTKTVVESNGNPFLNLGGLSVVAGVLSLNLTDTTTVEQLAPRSSKATYTVTPDQTIPGSVLDVGVSARTPQQALDIMNSIESLATVRLAQLQDQVNAPLDSQARIMLITDNDKATPNVSSLSRALIVVIAGGIVVTFLFTISLDTLIRRRKERKAARQPAHASEPDIADAPEAAAAEGTNDARATNDDIADSLAFEAGVSEGGAVDDEIANFPSSAESHEERSKSKKEPSDEEAGEEEGTGSLVGYHGRPR
jgi:capsular polysaccharide biosynthesis protein